VIRIAEGWRADAGVTLLGDVVLARSRELAVILRSLVFFRSGIEVTLEIFRAPETTEELWRTLTRGVFGYPAEPELLLGLVADDASYFAGRLRGAGTKTNWRCDARYEMMAVDAAFLRIDWQAADISASWEVPVAARKRIGQGAVDLWPRASFEGETTADLR
jgi:hypothetical protein